MTGEAPDPNTVIVDPREGGQKLLQFLQRRLDLPPSLLHRWIRTGQVRINGGRAKPFGLVAAGDSVRLPPFALGMSRRSKATGGQASPEQEPRQRTQALPPAPRPLQKDGDLWVFCKPAGLPTHPGTGHEDCPAVWRPGQGMPRSSPRLSIVWTRTLRASCWWLPVFPSCAS